MKLRTLTLGAAALAVAATAIAPGAARASSHREALAIVNDPCVDNTDLYAWVEPGSHDTLYLIAGYNGLHEPGQGNQQTRLCDGVLYEFHVVKGVDDLEDDLTYQILLRSTPPTRVDEGDLSLPVGGGKELLIQLGGVTQTYTVTKVENGTSTVIGRDLPVTPPNVGPRTDRIAYGLGTFDPTDPASSTVGLYDDAFAASFIASLGDGGSEGRAWVGTRDDGFYLDEKGIFDVINLSGKGVAKDVFAGFNLNVIALAIPTSVVTGTDAVPHLGQPGDDTMIGVWTSASRRQNRTLNADGSITECGPWVQVSRQGLPLVNAGLIGVQDQSLYLRTTPATDVENFADYFLSPVLVRDLEFLGVYDALGVDAATVESLKSNRTDILDAINLTDFPTPGAHNVAIAPGVTGDVLRLDLALPTQFPNGRAIPGGARPDQEQVDVSDVLITVIASGGAIALGDGVDYNDKEYLGEFPFLPLPHQGLTEGHGSTTP